uniref:Leucine-rich repeat-containing N-terminal plant-type domain-containing protein n=1 Tax=Lactuca sativa TaxID=4236 RepID=A0A9R1UYL0_LACSA|nr:hypothetical protein LSAT_V11C700371900 [Lactuca sativa]
MVECPRNETSSKKKHLTTNDMLIFGNDQDEVDKTKKFLASSFEMKDPRKAEILANALSGEISNELGNLKNLKLLNLFMNRLHGSIQDFVADYPDLQKLALWSINFTGVIPKNLGQNRNLQEIDLSSNKLTEDLGTCSTLVRVRLGENYLNGSIPDGLIYLQKLNLLELQNNYLSDNLSDNQNPSSSPLDLNGNSLSGAIPPDIGNCVHLTYLDLSQNNLSGSIPLEARIYRSANRRTIFKVKLF